MKDKTYNTGVERMTGWLKRTTLGALAALYMTLGVAGTANADFFEALRSPQPGQAQIVALGYKKGDLEKEVVKGTLKYKSDKLFASVSVPYVNVENCETGLKKEGIGDLEAELGIPLKIGKTDVLPLATVKLPTGEDEVCGDQYEIGALVAATRKIGRYMIDAAVGYNHRENAEDQYLLRLTPSYDIGNALKGSWRVGIENVAVFDKDDQSWSVRPLVRYTTKGGTHVTFGPGVTMQDGEEPGYDVGVRARFPLGKK